MGPETGAKVRRDRVPKDGRRSSDHLQIVLIHGLSVPSLIWKDIAPELSARGYRVLLYGTRPKLLVPLKRY